MNPLLRAGKRIMEAWRGSSPAPDCPRCEPLRRENEALQQEMERLRQENQAQKEENARLRESVEEAHRAGKRQAAPFSKGPPKANPKKNGRKPGEHDGSPTTSTRATRLRSGPAARTAAAMIWKRPGWWTSTRRTSLP